MASEQLPRQVPVAVVGAAAFMPGSTDLEGFWRNVLTGRDLLTDVPADRWLVGDYYDPQPRAADKTYGKRGAFLPRVGFDPVSYGILPNSLPAIDTSQLLGLMVADKVISDCAVGLPEDRSRVSVLLGVSSLQLLVEASARLHRPAWLKALREHGVAEAQAQSICDSIAAQFVPWQEETFPGLLTNVVSGRIANKFDLHGTNHTTDAACASSLAALYTAVAELSLQQSDLVITGGVDTMNDILMYTCFSSTPALSPTGDCRPFSDAADGTMLGEGVVMLALKRLDDAERDGDRVYAVIRGVGTSSDGRGTAIYAPLPAGQMRALRRTYEAAGYGPETVELVEAHGTGTGAGDAAEFAALREVFDASGRPDRQWCALGSVKSQIGHTKAAAGASGLLKAVLALQHKVLPPTIKVERPNPAHEVDSSPFYLNTEPRPWIRPAGPKPCHPRRASVSSFGFGGTNFHVTLEEYLPAGQSQAEPAWRLPAGPTELVLFSATEHQALLRKATELDLGRPLADIARQTQQDFGAADNMRLAIVAADAEDLAAKIASAGAAIENGAAPFAGQVYYGAGAPAPGLVGFLFPGQGSQYVGMGGGLAISLPAARAAWDRAAALDFGDIPLHRVAFPPPAFTDADRLGQQARLTATEWAQPALAVHSLALLEVLGGLGLAPDSVAGHSFGELVALHAAGAFDAETLIRLARRRGELMRDASAVSGAMLAVTAGREQAEAAAADLPDVWLANHNAPSQVVFAGTEPALEALASRLAARGITALRLNAATGFHSPLVAPAAEPLLETLLAADISAPVLPAYSGRDASVYGKDPDDIRRGLAAQIAAPVRFVDTIEAMYSRGVRTFVEVGAGATLTGLVGQILGEREHAAVSVDRKGRPAVTSLQEGLGQLAVRGLAMNFSSLWEGYGPPGSRPAQVHRQTEVMIDGGNYGRPYPPADGPAKREPARDAPYEPPAAPPASNGQPDPAPQSAVPVTGQAPGPVAAYTPPDRPVRAAPLPAGESASSAGWLRVLEEAQEQAAAAHAEFQRAMTDSHLAYLRMAGATFAGLLGTATGQLPQIQAPTPVSWPELPAIPAAASSAAEPRAVVAEALAQASVQTPALDAESIGALLLSVVAERTGYPVEMLNVDMELDTDLGIDSIKKVEILSVVRERVGEVPGGDLASLATLRTLRAIAERVGQPGPALAPLPAANGPPSQVRPSVATSPPARWVVRAVPAPASGLAMPGLTSGVLSVTDDGGGIAPLLVERLGGHGVRAEVVAEVPPDALGAIVLDGLRPVASIEEALEVQLGVFRTARRLAHRMEADGGVFVTVQDTGGYFGLSTRAQQDEADRIDPVRAWLGGIAALARTAAKEWPRASVKAIDCAVAQRPAAEVAAVIAAELITGGAAIAAGLGSDGTRISCELEPSPAAVDGGPPLGPESVIVATGGARGVTAASLRRLAAQCRPRLVLLGRTPLDAEPEGLAAATDEPALIQLLARQQAGGAVSRTPAEIAVAARQVLAAREVRATLSAIAGTGALVRYYPLDVTDRAALDAALAEVRSEWGPITGVVHGAGVLADALISAKTDDQFTRVFDTKVEGLRALLAATADDPLEVLCAFSSVAAQFGNPGQGDYAMANEVMNQVLSAEQARREGCLVRAIGWGPWLGGMVTNELAARFGAAGVPLLDLQAGAEALVAELGRPAGDVRVIVSANAGAVPPAAQDTLAAHVTVGGPAYAYLADHELGGVPVVPVATVLGWFAGAALAWRPTAGSIVLRDVRVLDKIPVPMLAGGRHQLVLQGSPRRGSGSDELGLALRDMSGQPHYRARAVASQPPRDGGRWQVPPGLAPLDEPYDGATLFHGPRLQAIRAQPAVGPLGAECTVAGARALGWPEAIWHLDPAAVDGGLQLAVLWAQRAGTGATLPMAITECRVHRRGAVEREVRCLVRAGHADDSTAACDVALIDPDGSPRVELLGVQLVRRPG